MGILKKEFQSIVIAGGGTGGHLFPGLAIAHYFYKLHPKCQIRFIGTKKGIEKQIIPKSNYTLHTLPAIGLYRAGVFKKIISLTLIPIAILHSVFWILRWKPDFVLGVGGYSSGPFLLACILLKQKFFIQEQNAYPGITNRFLGKYAHLSFLVYRDNYNFFKTPVIVGNPIRPAIHALWKNNSHQNKDKFQITILGGSGGSQIVNNFVTAALSKLGVLQQKIKIVHQSGIRDYKKLQNYYQQNNFDYSVKIFFDDMVTIYQNTNLFICRSGAGVFEMMAAGRIGILIPIANSSGDHQKKNALQLTKYGGCILLEEKDANSDKLVKIIKTLFKNKTELKAREKLATNYYQGNASEQIYSKIVHFFQKQINV